ncbi:hypothetical protein O181_035084 [Austropuccinia psidii MF-1]|uniref:Uncharacterized protein n=1 Tax=Austropuccinia psidii MF-1 TaxID=1389203 RepID=A0A9Q3HA68_9BASI|nr:hypothetical protein [Austropuccinia psidii MF-1]
MSLKEKTHINTICNVWVITPNGARKQFGMLIFMHEMSSAPPPDHLTPFPCLLSCMTWLPQHLRLRYASTPSITHFCTSTTMHRTMHTLLKASPDVLLSWEPHLGDQPYLFFFTPYHAYTTTVPYRYMYDLIHPYASSPLPLTMLMLFQCPVDMHMTPPPLLALPGPHLILSAAYHAYAPTVPYRYVSDPGTPCPPSAILALLNPCLIPSQA